MVIIFKSVVMMSGMNSVNSIVSQASETENHLRMNVLYW